MCSAIALGGGESPTYSLASETAGPSGAIAYALPSCCAFQFPSLLLEFKMSRLDWSRCGLIASSYRYVLHSFYFGISETRPGR
jgi:hypothetical protein